MKTSVILTLLTLTLAVTALDAQNRAATSTVAVTRLDPALDAIIAPGTRFEVLKEDYFGIGEGPLWIDEGGGYLIFSDIAANAIYKWTPDGALSVYLEKSGMVGTDMSNVNVANNGRLIVATMGSNGLALDPQGRLVLTAQGDRAIVRIEKDGKRTTLADRFEGKRINGPNDLAIKSNGSIYFTDPGSGLAASSPARELPYRGVFLVKDGRVQLLEKDFMGGSPNGIAFSPDEKFLYINAGGKIFRYDVRPDDTIANRHLLIDMTMRSDGMKVDARGNIYSSGPGGMWIISPEGKHLGTLPTSDSATNVAFGDADRKTVYVTGQRNLYRIRASIAGARR